ncbi:MAG: aminopeptidase P family protein [Clostridia bacterium]|nr:aminopeptidase P family protein [Clostridia bacterium]
MSDFWQRYARVKELNVKAYDRIRREIRAGSTEKELYDKVVDVYRSEGGEEVAYQGDFISGLRTCGIDGPATDKVIERGDTVIVDALCAVDGAWCDTTRTFFCGEPTDEQRKAYGVLLLALEETSKLLKPGVRACEIFRFMDSLLAKEGYGGLAHHAGHGLKRSWYEDPYFVAECGTVLEEDMLVALEPGIYLPGRFGMRIENNYRVTPSGGENVFGYTLKTEDFILDRER